MLLLLLLPLLASLGEHFLHQHGGVEARRTVGVAPLEQTKPVNAAWLLLLLLGGRAALGAGLHGLRVEEVGEVEALVCARAQATDINSRRVRARKKSQTSTRQGRKTMV